MKYLPLTTKIAIHQGHFDVADEPDWTGTAYEYWEKNPDTTFGEIREMLDDLDAGGEHYIGGGAQGCFTIRLAGPATAHHFVTLTDDEMFLTKTALLAYQRSLRHTLSRPPAPASAEECRMMLRAAVALRERLAVLSR